MKVVSLAYVVAIHSNYSIFHSNAHCHYLGPLVYWRYLMQYWICFIFVSSLDCFIWITDIISKVLVTRVKGLWTVQADLNLRTDSDSNIIMSLRVLCLFMYWSCDIFVMYFSYPGYNNAIYYFQGAFKCHWARDIIRLTAIEKWSMFRFLII